MSAAARAEALFNEGLALFGAKSYAEACAKFEESQKLDPAPGTLFRLATCEEEQGRFATAAQRWKEGASLLPTGDTRRASAEKNATETESKAGRLVLRASPQAPPGLAVALDDRMLGAGELGADILVDPGSHDLVITAPGHEPRTLTVTAASGETREVALMPGPALPAPKPTSAPIRTPPPPRPAPPPVGFFSQHKVSIATLGGGIALAAAGTGVALDIIGGRYRDFVRTCERPEGCSKTDKEAIDARATAVNVLFPLAAAAGLAAVGIFLFAEPEPAAQPRTQVGLALGPMGMSLTVRR